MSGYHELMLVVQSSMLGCITETVRMVKVFYSCDRKSVLIVAYFSEPPRVYEKDLILDISSEIECTLVGSAATVKSVCVYAPDVVVGDPLLAAYEESLLGADEALYNSFVAYLRYGESNEFMDLEQGDLTTLDESQFDKLHR